MRQCRPLTQGSLDFEGVTTESAQNASSPGTEAEGDSIAEGLQMSAKSHPTRKQLRVFLQLLLRELLIAAPSTKQNLPLEVLLEVSAQGLPGYLLPEVMGSARVWYVQGDLRADFL